MKNLIKLFFIFFIVSSCNNVEQVQENPEVSLERIAQKYGYRIGQMKTDSQIYTVKTKSELVNLLDQIKTNFETPKFKQSKFSKKISDSEINKKCDSIKKYLNNKNIQTNGKTTEHSKDGEEPPYTYSVSYYFDNRFPSVNVVLTIYYNTNSTGQITSAEIVTTTYGYSLGSTYSQTGTVSHITNNGVLVYQVSGSISQSVGIGSFTLTNTNLVTYIGAFSIYSNNNGGGIDYVRQYPGQQNDYNTPMNE